MTDRIVHITDIKWDMDAGAEPPETISIPYQIFEGDIQDSDLSEVVSDWLSDEYGFCHFGFTIAMKS